MQIKNKTPFSVSKNIRWALLACSVALMGFTMPSCPGQQAMQEQIDSMKSAQAELTKRVQMDEALVKQMSETLTQIKTESQGIGTTVGQLKTDSDQMKLSLQSIEAKLAPKVTKRTLRHR
jgi:septal ring factor EnvC (AmiA/AmiB activator)